MTQKIYRSVKIIGFILYIPLILAAGPLMGLEAGRFFIEKWGWPGMTPLVLAGLGFLAGVIESFKLARRALEIESQKKES